MTTIERLFKYVAPPPPLREAAYRHDKALLISIFSLWLSLVLKIMSLILNLTLTTSLHCTFDHCGLLCILYIVILGIPDTS